MILIIRFILTIWNVNLNRLIGSINYNDRFILTIWNVNAESLKVLTINSVGFILTIWNVNSFSNAFFTYGANVLY